MSDMPKLAKFLADYGIASRRKAEELILAGKVKVNGVVEKKVATRVTPGKDEVQYLGKVVGGQLLSAKDRVVLALNKPTGIVSTVSDPDGKPTVMKYVPPKYANVRLFPVGRLDEDSEGLMLLTNDGDLAYRLTHPKFQIPKTYEVNITGRLSRSELNRLRSGIPLKDGRTKRAQVDVIEDQENSQFVRMTIHEGRHHQIRRMMHAVNHEVVKLKRVRMGDFTLGGLRTGEVRLEKAVQTAAEPDVEAEML